MSDHTFCKLLLSAVMIDVRKVTTVEERKEAWTWKDGTRCAEFHGPNSFYWYDSVHCLWEARAQGWMAWLAKYHPEINDNSSDEIELKQFNNLRPFKTEEPN